MLALRSTADSTTDPCLYHYSLVLNLGNLLSASSDSDGHEVLAHRVWHLHVGPQVLVPVTSLVLLYTGEYYVLMSFFNSQLGVYHHS
jgi:hypothetical protein